MSTEESRLFHISDVLSFYTGVTMVINEELTMPDGSIRPEWHTEMTPMIEIVAHVAEQDLWVDKETNEYDAFRFSAYISEVRNSLKQQFIWLEKVDKPVFPDGTQEENDAFAREVVNAFAEKFGAWLEVKPASVIKKTFHPSSNNEGLKPN